MKQLSLFKADQLQHQDSILGVFHKPCKGVSTCMLAPIPLFCLAFHRHDFSKYTVKIRCLAIDDSGLIIVAPLLEFDGDGEKLFLQLIEYIEHAKQNILGSDDAINPLFMNQIKNPDFWCLHKKTPSSVVGKWFEVSKKRTYNSLVFNIGFYRDLKSQLIDNINDLTKCLNPVIKKTMVHRPSLDVNIISSFLCRAKSHNESAIVYAEQALLIEPIPVLRLISYEPGNTLIETIFSGESLPKALSKHLAINRSIIKYLSKNAMAIPDMSAKTFIIGLKVIQHLERVFWPKDKKTWEYLIERIEELYLMDENKTTSASTPTFEVLLTSYKLTHHKHNFFSWQNSLLKHKFGTSLVESTLALYKSLENTLPELELSEGCIALEYKADDFSCQFAMSFLEKDPSKFCIEWFKFHPNLEPISVENYEFNIVNTLSICNYFGAVFNNCLNNAEHVLLNLFPNKMLFSISENNKPIALITVAIDQVFAGRDTAHQLKGVDNTEVDEVVKKACVRFMIALDAHKEEMKNFYLISNSIKLI